MSHKFSRLGTISLTLVLLVVGLIFLAVTPSVAEERDRTPSDPSAHTDIDRDLAVEGVVRSMGAVDDVLFYGRSPDELLDHSLDFQTIFGVDNRERVTPTTSHPWRTISAIEGGFSGQYSHCTGTFIGPNVVLTAAHCLYRHDVGWSESQMVVPGIDTVDNWPFGYGFAQHGWVPQEWILTGDFAWDWGLLVMPDSSLGNTVGWMDIGLYSTQTLQSPNFNPMTAGYPGDKPLGTMWVTSEPSFLSVNDAFLINRLDAYPGQSGSAVWSTHDELIAGVFAFETTQFNGARRINEMVVASLLNVCDQLNCSFSYVIEGQSPDPTPTPTPSPTPTTEPTPTQTPPSDPTPPTQEPDPPASETPSFASGPDAQRSIDNFFETRARTDWPVEISLVDRTWMWGPSNNSAALEEQYLGAPGDSRVVMYFDKSRMEDNQYRATSPWHVTNGLLVVELITGQMNISDHDFIQRQPADVQVAGDDHPESPTYAMLDPLKDRQPHQIGEAVIRRLLPDGSTPHDNSLIDHHVVATHYVSETDHAVASVFWNFMNSTGPVMTHQGMVNASLFENPFFATGFPITEAYWVHVPVGGQWQDVLLQCFQRRCLTYTPANPPGWQVEAGNVGQHYYRWRYGDAPTHP
jgi:V8-like Glu-specific endopeptidase